MYYNLLSKIKFLGGAVATIVQHLHSRRSSFHEKV